MRIRFDYTLVDWEGGDPFEIDDGNRPHLFKHVPFGVEDLYDMLDGEPVVAPADITLGPADWLLLAELPGEGIAVAPLAPPRAGPVEVTRQARPIGLYHAGGPEADEYHQALREEG